MKHSRHNVSINEMTTEKVLKIRKLKKNRFYEKNQFMCH